MAAQSGNEGLCLPFSEGRIGGKAPAFGRPSGAFCQARIRGSLIDKDETRQGLVEEPLSAIDPKITRLGDLWSTLLACLEAFFYYSAQVGVEIARPWRGGLQYRAPRAQRTVRPKSFRHGRTSARGPNHHEPKASHYQAGGPAWRRPDSRMTDAGSSCC